MDKKEYIELINANKITVPVFYHPKWLDAVCTEGIWDVIVHKNHNNINGIWVYYLKKKYGIKYITMPALTPWSGPFLFYKKNSKTHKLLTFNKKVLTELYKSLPDLSLIEINIHYSIKVWLPLYWLGLKQSTRYSYILKLNDKSINQIFENFNYKLKYDIKKSNDIIINRSENINSLYNLKLKNFNSKNEINYSLDILKNIYNNFKNNIFLLEAKDKNNNLLGSAMFLYDKYSTYYLIGARDKSYKGNNCLSKIIWEAIKIAYKLTPLFDFEGSMIENVERFFRNFNAEPVPYSFIKKPFLLK